ncbi:MAG: NADH-quinone oxidoreductase subunit NuoF [Chthoniobacterales bacterium]|nr:NADH-quinone oxidoreductase subunit NuoF [Chthoniobacterales bacterium]
MTDSAPRQADSLPPELVARIDETITRYPVSRRSASVPLLHLWQNHFGYIDDSGVNWIAAKLGLEPINILELVTFYPWFRQTAPGRKTIRVCRTLSCAMAGSYDLREALCRSAGIDPHAGDHGHGATSPDGSCTIEFVECLASCGSAPVCLVGDDLHEKVAATDAPSIVDGSKKAADKTLRAPHPQERRLILRNIGLADYDPSLECYLRHGGYESLRKALKMEPAAITAEVKASNLRGRGGAGFPTGVKWGFIKRDDGKPHYIVVNGDESEPGTFKDRYILHEDPHQLLEGIMIAAWALNVHLSYIYIRCEFPEAARIVEKAIAEARAAGFVGKDVLGSGFDCEIHVHQGAGAYICGEETSLLESLEGRRPYPRIKPPFFPAVFGLYNSPTIVNNVETLCHVKHIIAMGSGEFAKMGSPGDGGTRTLCVSGDVVNPGYYELGCGQVTVGQLINGICGGLKPGRKLKAIIPGGSSAKVLKAGETYKMKRKGPDGTETTVEVDLMDLVMDANNLAAAGSMIGSAGVMILDDSRDMLWVLNNLNDFYAHESCGQCTPCREGSLWMSKVTTRMLHGDVLPTDADQLVKIADNIAGRTVCAFGEACAWPTQSFVGKFRGEFSPRAGSNGH